MQFINIGIEIASMMRLWFVNGKEKEIQRICAIKLVGIKRKDFQFIMDLENAQLLRLICITK